MTPQRWARLSTRGHKMRRSCTRLTRADCRRLRTTAPRGIEVVRRAATMMNWQSWPAPGPLRGAPRARGRCFSSVHYKHKESLLAMGMEVAVDGERGAIHIERVVCA